MSKSTRRTRCVFTLLAGSLLSSLTLSGCVTHHHHHGSRKPAVTHTETHVVTARNPSHGRVHFHPEHRINLVYDGGWGGYWVRELPHHYYYAGRYFRWHGHRWQRSRHPHGPWVGIETRRLPRGLDSHQARIARVEANRSWKPSKGQTTQERREAKRQRRQVEQEHRKDKREVKEERPERRRERAQARRDVEDEGREARRQEKGERYSANQEPRDEKRAQKAERREPRSGARGRKAADQAERKARKRRSKAARDSGKVSGHDG